MPRGAGLARFGAGWRARWGLLAPTAGGGGAGSGGRLGIPGLSRSLSSGLRGSGLEVAGRWALHGAAVARSPQLRWSCGGQWRACVRAGPDCGRLGGPGKAERGWSRSGVTRPGPGAAGGGDAGPLASVAFCRPPARVSGVPTWPGAELSGPSPSPKAPSLPAGTCRHFSSRPSPLTAPRLPTPHSPLCGVLPPSQPASTLGRAAPLLLVIREQLKDKVEGIFSFLSLPSGCQVQGFVCFCRFGFLFFFFS